MHYFFASRSPRQSSRHCSSSTIPPGVNGNHWKKSSSSSSFSASSLSSFAVLFRFSSAFLPLLFVLVLWIGISSSYGAQSPVPASSFWFIAIVVAFSSSCLCLVESRVGFVFLVYGLWTISLCFHEFSHAYMALKGGDFTVESKGYLTLDPLHYIDPLHSLITPTLCLLMGGFALPGGAIWVEEGLLRSARWRSYVMAAGPLSDLLGSVVTGVIFNVLHFVSPYYPFRPTPTASLYCGVAVVAALQVEAVVLNSLPLPGLDGWGMVEPWFSRKSWVVRFCDDPEVSPILPYCSTLFLLLYFNLIETHVPIFTTITEWTVANVLRIPPRFVQAGWRSFPSLFNIFTTPSLSTASYLAMATPPSPTSFSANSSSSQSPPSFAPSSIDTTTPTTCSSATCLLPHYYYYYDYYYHCHRLNDRNFHLHYDYGTNELPRDRKESSIVDNDGDCAHHNRR